jgi:hypothetical protein
MTKYSKSVLTDFLVSLSGTLAFHQLMSAAGLDPMLWHSSSNVLSAERGRFSPIILTDSGRTETRRDKSDVDYTFLG